MRHVVPNEILRQLGGIKFSVMTGAKNYVGSENSLSFQIGKNKSKANKVIITLTPDDLYTVEFGHFSMSKLEYKTLQKTEGIYCDTLCDHFETYTGLYTSL